MASYENFYPGMDNGLDPNHPNNPYSNFTGYIIPTSYIGLATDVRTANQLQETGNKLNTGAQTIEVSGVSTEILESIPKQHLGEINRLAKLAGVELTFHGPLVEATGISREGWDESKRLQAERQLSNAIERSHELDPKGNVITTLHTTAGLPEMIVRSKTKEGVKIDELWVIDEREGRFSSIKPKINQLTGKKEDPYKELEKLNTENWFRRLSQTSFHATQGSDSIESASRPIRLREEKLGVDTGLTEKDLIEFYKKSKTEEGQKQLKDLTKNQQTIIQEYINKVNYGEIYVRDAYSELQNLFNEAYNVAEREDHKEDLVKLNKYKEQMKDKIKWVGNPEKLPEFAESIVEGINVLNTLKEAPQTLRPLNKFVIEKASDTYSNVALNSYKKFKDTSPIISLENPPAGGGLSRAEDMRELIKITREKFAEKAEKELGMPRSQAEKQAEKLIGATWDVGHINMIRKYGYTDKDIIEETKRIAPFVKHVHLSDNFGFEHTELPMGMGNVSTKEHFEALQKYNKQVKKIIEAGNWYQHFKVPPIPETFEAFGSPVYKTIPTPNWQTRGMMGSYFSGLGPINPDVHQSIYGAGFSNLPPELGGQIAGTGQSRFSGTPID